MGTNDGGGGLIRLQSIVLLCVAFFLQAHSPSEILETKTIYGIQPAPDGDDYLFQVRELSDKKDLYAYRIYQFSVEKGVFPLTGAQECCFSPKWSPNGKWIAFLWATKNSTALCVMPSCGGERVIVFEGEQDVDSFEWLAGSDSFIFSMMDEIDGGEDKQEECFYLCGEPYGERRLWYIPLGAQETPEVITSRGYDVDTEFSLSPDGKRVVFSYEETLDKSNRHIAILDWEKEKLHLLAPQSLIQISPRYTPDGASIIYEINHSPGGLIHNRQIVCSREDGLFSFLMDLTPNEASFSIGDFCWMDEKHFVLLEPRGTRKALYKFSIEGDPVELFEENLTQEWFVSEIAFAQGKDAFYFVGEKPGMAQEIYRYSLLDGRLQRQTFLHGEEISALKVEIMHWNSFDGMEMEGLVVYPSNYNPSVTYPLLVDIHGGPAGSFSKKYLGTPYPYPHLSLIKEGFAIFMPNIRGSDGYGRLFRESVRRDFGGADFQDVMTGIDQLIERKIADPDRLGMMGWSYGGYMTAWAITQTDRFQAVSMGAGPTNLLSMAGTMDYELFMHSYMGEFYESPSLYYERSPLMHAPSVTTPCLIQHGQKDRRVPFTQSLEFYRALKRLGKDVSFFIYPRIGHNIEYPEEMLDIMEKNIDWFSFYMQKPVADFAATI